MRGMVIVLCLTLGVVALVSAAARADTLHLKDG